MKEEKKVLYISPTHNIIKKTLDKVCADEAAHILPNCFCFKWQKLVKQDSFLKQLPLPLSDCEKCRSLYSCPVTEVMAGDAKVTAMTYRKLEALMLSHSDIARQILERLDDVDLVILDEAHTISLPSVVRVEAFKQVVIPFEFKTLNKILDKWREQNEEYENEIEGIKKEGNQGHWIKHLSRRVYNEDNLNFQILSTAWNELVELARKRKEINLPDSDIIALRDIIGLMSGSFIAITYLKEHDREEGTVHLAGNYWITIRALMEFLAQRVKHATHLFVSGTLVEPYPEFFAGLSGKDVANVTFPDIRNTNSKMLIYPDTWRLSSQNFHKNLDRIMSRICELSEKHADKEVYIIAPSARKAEILKEKLKDGAGERKLSVDYYRSDQTIGVENLSRVCIAIGLAEVPSNTYDHMARGEEEEDRWVDSQQLRAQAVQAATWQAWSRVKDPEGKEESIIYCMGTRAELIRDVVTWGPGRRLGLVKSRHYKLPGGKEGKRLLFKAVVDELIEPPRLYTERRTSSRLDRHSVGEYIDRVGQFDFNEIYSQFMGKMPCKAIKEDIDRISNHRDSLCDLNSIYHKKVDNLPIFNNRQIVQKNALFAHPSDDVEEWINCILLFSLFATRADYIATQNSPSDNKGGYGYRKSKLEQRFYQPALFFPHLRGRLTLGFYQIYNDDQVKWICFDIDDHKGERNQDDVRAEVRGLLAVLEKYNIPYMLEASGSPSSYHVWIFTEPTKTLNAYRFSRQIKAEAEIECEVFPKQKERTARNQFGNLVKIPLGVNRKNGARSRFLDPITFEPYAAEVPIPGFIRLREVPDADNKAREKTKRNARCPDKRTQV